MIYFWKNGVWQGAAVRPAHQDADGAVLEELNKLALCGDFTGFDMANFELALRTVYLRGADHGILKLSNQLIGRKAQAQGTEQTQ